MFTIILVALIIFCATILTASDHNKNGIEFKEEFKANKKIKVITAELYNGIIDDNERRLNSSQRRLESSCGNINSTKNTACCYWVCDGWDCASVCCDRHSYSNMSENKCGCCIMVVEKKLVRNKYLKSREQNSS